MQPVIAILLSFRIRLFEDIELSFNDRDLNLFMRSDAVDVFLIVLTSQYAICRFTPYPQTADTATSLRRRQVVSFIHRNKLDAHFKTAHAAATHEASEQQDGQDA